MPPFPSTLDAANFPMFYGDEETETGKRMRCLLVADKHIQFPFIGARTRFADDRTIFLCEKDRDERQGRPSHDGLRSTLRT